jgi:hypothetical protein
LLYPKKLLDAKCQVTEISLPPLKYELKHFIKENQEHFLEILGINLASF